MTLLDECLMTRGKISLEVVVKSSSKRAHFGDSHYITSCIVKSHLIPDCYPSHFVIGSSMVALMAHVKRDIHVGQGARRDRSSKRACAIAWAIMAK